MREKEPSPQILNLLLTKIIFLENARTGSGAQECRVLGKQSARNAAHSGVPSSARGLSGIPKQCFEDIPCERLCKNLRKKKRRKNKEKNSVRISSLDHEKPGRGGVRGRLKSRDFHPLPFCEVEVHEAHVHRTARRRLSPRALLRGAGMLFIPSDFFWHWLVFGGHGLFSWVLMKYLCTSFINDLLKKDQELGSRNNFHKT